MDRVRVSFVTESPSVDIWLQQHEHLSDPDKRVLILEEIILEMEKQNNA